MRRRLGRANPRFVYLAITFICIGLFLLSKLHSSVTPPRKAAFAEEPDAGRTVQSCIDLPGANDTLVVIKTGSTEIRDKLPIHFSTTLRCYPNYLIFSDLNERFEGEQVIDALEDVDASFKDQHDDFELYRRLRKHGRKSLKPSELSGPVSRPQGASGKPHNPGWKLDKWKFLPMMRRTLQERPDMKWYVFVETDTYMFWKTLLAYLEALDSTKPYYMGGQINIGDITFGLGGTGFIVSRPALGMVVQHYIDRKREWEDFTNNHWAGDCVLGKAYLDAGVPLTHSWPIMQGDDIGDMNYGRTSEDHRLWCHPTVSYHHLSPAVIKEMWNFEQSWLSNEGAHPSQFLRHKDVYLKYILPRVSAPKTDWDNHSDNDEGPVSSLEDCRAVCEKNDPCVQYSVDRDGRCLTTSRPNLGEKSRGTDSGWIYERMKKFYDSAQACGYEGWIS